MTTDHPPGRTGDAAPGRARAAAPGARQPAEAASSGRKGTGSRRRRQRRPHAALGGRIVAAGLSASAALGLVAVMASPPRTAAPATGSEATVVVVRRTSGQSTGAPAPTVSRTDAAPVTTSQAS